MSSWFGSASLDLTSALGSLSETVQSVSESVQDAIPTEHKDFLAKLTLNTDEMISERENFRQEANKKAEAKDRLNKILPWETLDPEREILVEECKEAILELSGREETFFGPYEMPLLNVQLESKEENEEEGTEEEAGESEADGDGAAASEAGDDAEAPTETRPGSRHMEPSEESLEKLSKLKPLPPLLEEFDLDLHVGLIQSVMKEDAKLVAMQANFSGGGARERTFWHNYFFHCAFTRYEAGLSLEEIWSYGEDSSNIASHAENVSSNDVVDEGVVSDSAEGDAVVEGTEDGGSGDNDAGPRKTEESAEAVESTVDLNVDASETPENNSLAELSELSAKNGFELIDEDIDVAADPELDELEAEIARELENM